MSERLNEITLIPYTNDEIQRGQVYLANLIQPDKTKKRIAWVCCPICGKQAPTTLHTLIEHDDGTISLSPSLQCPAKDCTAHYHIKYNKITWC